MMINAYISFEGRCDEALEFYRTALGAEIEAVMRYGESPDEPPPGMLPPGSENKVMHSSFRIGESTVMATDGECSGNGSFQGISLALSADSVEHGRRLFEALSDGGNVAMPYGPTFFSPGFGMVADRFGVHWMVVTPAQPDSGSEA